MNGRHSVAPEVVVTPSAGARPRLDKLREIFVQEFYGLHPRLVIVGALLALLPPFVGGRVRVYSLRAAGFRIGHGTVMYGTPSLTGNGPIHRRLLIGRLCQINVGCALDLEAEITIGDRVGIGPQVMILTSTHAIGAHEQRADPRVHNQPVAIGDGCWIGARCTILPGVTIGAGSVIAAGTVVNRDVPPDTLLAAPATQEISLARWRAPRRKRQPTRV